jgi:lipopolysaccharide/colanic/teichoic acid biosynthesis glycosyltransferase
MRLRSPTSKTKFRVKLATTDVFWAIVSPFVAVWLRDPILLETGDVVGQFPPAYQYAFVTIFCGLISLLLFRVGDGMSHFFSVHEVLAVCCAVGTSATTSSATVFVLNRLDTVPRSTPAIYVLVFAAGLIGARTLSRLFHKDAHTQKRLQDTPIAAPPQHLRRVLLIGVDRFAATTIRLLDVQRPRTTQIVAALDPRAEFHGRSISGVNIVGRIEDLEAIVDEYEVHGVEIDEVWLSDSVALPEELLDRLADQCSERGYKLKRVSTALNLEPRLPPETVQAFVESEGYAVELGDYFKLKRAIDILASSFLLIVLAPLALVTICVVLFDVGAPALFWQQRIGRHGRKFLLYKFRTYHAPFDRSGARIAEEQRLSKLGRAIRAARLDEIPQLLNVLVGDMSLIGPRPLLPVDQPSDPRLRLSVRPGITGWAQLNGGTFVNPTEKDALDVWYITHASLALDMRIALDTVLFALTGERMNRSVIEEAMRWREQLRAKSEDSKDVAQEGLRSAAE